MVQQPPRNKPPEVLRADFTPLEELSAFERWILPNMEEGVTDPDFAIASPDNPKPLRPHVPLPDDEPEEPEVVPLTAEEVEEIRQAAHDDGFAQGKQEGYDAGRTQGYNEGYASGETEVRNAAIRLNQICRTLIEAIAPNDDALETVLQSLVTKLATEIVRRELKLDSSGVLSVVREAIRCIPPGSQRIRVHLNPDDIALVEGAMPDMVVSDAQWRLLPHRSISPGGCIIDTDEAVVDARAEKRLGVVLQQMYDKQAQALEQDTGATDSVSQLMDEVPAFAEPEPADDSGYDHE